MAAPLAQVVLSSDGLVGLVNRQAEVLFGVSSRDVGRPFRDLELSYRPLELRRHIEQAQAERRTVRISDVGYTQGSELLSLEVQIGPLVGAGSTLLGVSIAFHDRTEFQRLTDELSQANRQLETPYEELQSTNEELGTTNEELQSTNDELQTINDELQERTSELNHANDFLASILASLRAGVVVLGPDLHVQAWNSTARELWGLRPEEAVGEHF